jgi:hypothetical protein
MKIVAQGMDVRPMVMIRLRDVFWLAGLTQ